MMIRLLFVVLLLIPMPVFAQGVGIWSRSNCTTITSGVRGATVCWDSTRGQWRVHNGSTFSEVNAVNIGAYGAVGDDATDNQTALTNAIADAFLTPGIGGTTGGALYIPPGIYRHSGQLTWPNRDFVVFGASDSASVLKYTGTATGNLINSDGSTIPQTFRDLGFVSSAAAAYLFDAMAPGRLTFDQVRFRAEAAAPTLLRINGPSAGVAAQRTVLMNPQFACASQAATGLQVNGLSFSGSNIVNIFGGAIQQCTTVGAELNLVRGVNIFGTNIEGSPRGVRINGGQQITLDSLWLESNTNADIEINASTVSSVAVEIRNSTFATSAPAINIDIAAAGGGLSNRGHRILGNHIGGAATTANIRLANSATVTDTMIAFNTFSNTPDISQGAAVVNTLLWGNINGSTATNINQLVPVLQANLGTPPNGSLAYCSDCTIANPCAGGGTGALAKRLNATWVCN